MSWQIPTQIEQDIIAGKAKYQTFQTGNGGQSILPVPPNSYVVIFGYDFSPAGGGWTRYENIDSLSANVENSVFISPFETQQLSFYTGTDFFPFIHHVDLKTDISPRFTDTSVPDASIVTSYKLIQQIDNKTIARQVYITSTNDVTITHGLILQSSRATANAIPITNRTPQGLTYGGSGQIINTQTNFGPAGTPLQFMQPSPKDFQDFAFGLLPANADGQAFATPDTTNGLVDATFWANTFLGATIRNLASFNYFLNLHYAIYSKTIPEQRG